MGTGGMGLGMGWMWVFWLLLIVGVVLLVAVAVRAVSGGVTRVDRGSASMPRRSRAREVLDERYARGELTTEQYRERLQALGEGT
jgi:putative membrane protein